MPLELDQPTPDMSTDMSQSTEQPIGLDTGEIDREGGMAKQDLTKIASYAEKLDARLQDTDQLEAWVQKKIAVAAENLASVYHYLAYEMTVNEYAEYLRKNGLLSEGVNSPAVRKLMEAKAKIKALKQAQIEKKTEKKVAEGALRGGERPCTECGGSGMVYEEPKAIPDAVKGKVAKYNTMMKATKAAHKRMDANHNGIPDDEEFGEDSTDTKTTTKTQHGTATATFGADGKRKGVVHKDEREYSDGGDDIATNAKSGKGTKSHAKSQSAEEKAKKAPAQKMSPKSDKTWGKKDGVNFDNRDGAPAKPKKEKEVDETYGQGVYEAAGDKKKCPPMSHIKKMCQDGKSVAEICKMHPDCDQKELKQMVADCKNNLSTKKDVKETAATMWNSVKETAAYMAEKKAIEKKDKPMKGNKIAGEGNAYGNAVVHTPAGEEIKINGKGTGDIKKESTDFTRMQEQLARLNRSETKTVINENSEVNRLRTLTNLFKG
jgi:hypothetical protein